MKYVIIFFCIFLHHLAKANPIRGHSICKGQSCDPNWRESDCLFQKKRVISSKKKALSCKNLTSKKNSPLLENGNLPKDYQHGPFKKNSFSSPSFVKIIEKSKTYLKKLPEGSFIQCIIDQRLRVSTNSDQPVRAMIVEGHYIGSYFLGKAQLERSLKRIILNFYALLLPKNEEIYDLKAKGCDEKGSIGLKGKYYSSSGTFFLASLLSASGAGVLDVHVQRKSDRKGGYTTEPSLPNIAKQSGVTALAETTKYFSDHMKKDDGIIKSGTFQKIQIFLESTPSLKQTQ